MEEQKLRIKPALKHQMNVEKIKFVAFWYSLKFVAGKEQHKCTKNYKLNSCELVWR